MSCHVISEGAKFTPALADGKAAKSAVFQRIRGGCGSEGALALSPATDMR